MILNEIINNDCMSGMKEMADKSVDFTLTDIPYNAVNRKSNGLRELDKEFADEKTFEIIPFLDGIYRVTKNSVCVFCGKEQFSEIYSYFANKKGTVRPIIWEKTNPSPMNGEYVYESGVELAVWFKKRGSKTFNAFCKNTVFRFPNGKKDIHPTQKNTDLFKELIKDNSNEGDIIFDPCMGSGTTAIAAIELNRQYFGFELNEKAHKLATERIQNFNKTLKKPKKYEPRFVILDLFCGAGGFSYGLHMNKNFKTAVALDFNSFATNTFKQNMPDCEVVTGDITDENVRKFVIEKSKELKVNMVVGGPPCQGYSLKGKNLGLDDERNFLFQEYLKIVEELQPEIFIIENVKNILASANGWFKDQIIERVTNMGYFVECGVLNSKDFGVPQMRQRAFFLCSKTKKINLPKNEMENYITVKEAISDLSYLNSGEGSFESKYLMDAQSEYQKVMRKNSDKLYNHQATKHSEIALTKLSLIKAECGKECLPTEMHGKQIFATTWGRLKWNDISPTIDTRFDTPSNGTNSHPELNRSITPREAARIQSFPDIFIFYGNKTQICKQIGNAVPPLLAKAIGDKIIDEYNDKK